MDDTEDISDLENATKTDTTNTTQTLDFSKVTIFLQQQMNFAEFIKTKKDVG